MMKNTIFYKVIKTNGNKIFKFYQTTTLEGSFDEYSVEVSDESVQNSITEKYSRKSIFLTCKKLKSQKIWENHSSH